ncbi:MAG: TlpA family protein disulfide reductase [Chthoniobacterales bacterium]
MKNLCAALLLCLILAAPTRADATAIEAWATLQEAAATLTKDLPADEKEGRTMLIGRLQEQREKFAKFLTDYPDSDQRWEGRMAVLQIDNSLAVLDGRPPDAAQHRAELVSIAADEAAPENIRSDASLVLLQLTSQEFEADRTEASARGLTAAIHDFLERFPEDPRKEILIFTEAQAAEVFDVARARELYGQTAQSKNSDLADAGKTSLELLDLREKPLELEFTAVDGRKVNLADLRGQVVLLDFWATWCEPCVEEVPNLVATYEKFRERGFTIVGISLDKDKAALEKFTKENKMDWPQFFDGKGWDNEVAKRFKIQSVPTMWLLDREGKLIDATPRGRLEKAVERLLDKS